MLSTQLPATADYNISMTLKDEDGDDELPPLTGTLRAIMQKVRNFCKGAKVKFESLSATVAPFLLNRRTAPLQNTTTGGNVIINDNYNTYRVTHGYANPSTLFLNWQKKTEMVVGEIIRIIIGTNRTDDFPVTISNGAQSANTNNTILPNGLVVKDFRSRPFIIEVECVAVSPVVTVVRFSPQVSSKNVLVPQMYHNPGYFYSLNYFDNEEPLDTRIQKLGQAATAWGLPWRGAMEINGTNINIATFNKQNLRNTPTCPQTLSALLKLEKKGQVSQRCGK